MDPRLLQYYNLELQHLREMGAEFAQQFPKVAARLSMNGLEVADPYVERLLEGVAFMASRRSHVGMFHTNSRVSIAKAAESFKPSLEKAIIGGAPQTALKKL